MGLQLLASFAATSAAVAETLLERGAARAALEAAAMHRGDAKVKDQTASPDPALTPRKGRNQTVQEPVATKRGLVLGAHLPAGARQ